jgi:glycosyltransferase involved in cell wall biosynthesis
VLPGFAKWAGRALLGGAFRRTQEALRGADAVYGVSPKYLEWGLQRAGREARPADAMFPLGYELPEWGETDRRALEEKLQSLGVDPARERAAFVGTFGRTYDLATVIDAARRIGTAGPQFVLCGAGEREAEWRERAAGLPNVTFAGWLPAGQLGCLLSTAKYGLAAYAAQAPQGLPNKVIEYMAAGLPILCSLAGEARELLVESGCGVYYPAGDAGGLADALSALAADPARRAAMGVSARAVFAASYSASQIFNDMADRFESLARAGRASAKS